MPGTPTPPNIKNWLVVPHKGHPMKTWGPSSKRKARLEAYRAGFKPGTFRLEAR